MVALTRNDLLQWAESSVAFYGLAMERVGTVVLAQLHAMQVTRTLPVFAVTDEIKALEGRQVRSHTVAEARFNHPPLVGLYKKHFTAPSFLAKNLWNFAKSKDGRKHFQETWKSLAAESKSGLLDDAFIGCLVDEMTVGAYQAKSASNALTGEWIVFAKRAEGNCYLTLASHCETNDDIYKRVVLCAEFDRVGLSDDEV